MLIFSVWFFTLGVHENSSTEFKDKASKKDSGVSLSDFLDRKLHTTSVLPRTVQVLYSPRFWSFSS